MSDVSNSDVPPWQYTVVVDFHESRFTDDELEQLFEGAQHLEGIGQNQHQVGLGVEASNNGDACRRAWNYVEAAVEMKGGDAGVLGVHVYGPNGEEVFD